MEQEPLTIWSRPRRPSLLQQAEADQKALDDSMVTVSLGPSRSVRVFETGTGAPLLCFPMVKELNFVYAPQVERFQETHRVVLYEPTLSRTTRVSINDRAEEARLLLDSLGIDSAHILAWSDAGSAAYLFAKCWPDRCRSAVFLGLADRFRFRQPVQLFVRLLEKLPLEALVPSTLFARFLSRYLSGPEVHASWVVKKATSIPKLTRLFKHSVLPNLIEHRPQKGEVRIPSLVISGDADALVSLVQAQRMARILSDMGDAVIIPGGEHFLGYVHANAVNEIIERFYREVSESVS